jgi:hypothetical protein
MLVGFIDIQILMWKKCYSKLVMIVSYHTVISKIEHKRFVMALSVLHEFFTDHMTWYYVFQ